MSFSSQFSKSQEKSYQRNIATKIYEVMSKLRAGAKSSPTSAKRWVWELIQNAKDVNVDGKVRVLVDVDLDGDDPHVAFKHNGAAFLPENIRFLIEQVSSKDRTKDEDGRPTTTGKFGTGFLTTHLLSERVVIRGVTEGDDFTARKFKLALDRSGSSLEAIINAVKAAKDSLADVDAQPEYTGYDPKRLNTSFRYDLPDEAGKDVARAGLADLDVCLPYTLAFVPEIASVEYPDHEVSLQATDEERVDGEVQFLSVTIAHPAGFTDPTTSSIAVLSSGLTTIAIPVKKSGETVRILPLGPQVPRLFCDFPLLGTESFPFPVIINNPTFNPTEPRDGVFLTETDRPVPDIDHNKSIIEEALGLYLVLLETASEKGWENLHLLAAVKPMQEEIDKLDEQWYKTEILEPIQTTILQIKIVRTAADTIAPIYSPNGNIFFPSNPKKEIRRRIWRCCSTWIPTQLPAEGDVDLWYEIIWPACDRLTLDQVASFIEQTDTIDKLAGELSDGMDVYGWLKEFYATLKLSDVDFLSVVSKRRIFPNQNGTFKKKAELSRGARDIDPELLDILKLLGTDLRNSLLATEIDTDLADLAQKDGSFVVSQITTAVNKLLVDRNVLERNRPATAALLAWFDENQSKAEELFAILYEQKHRLYDEAQIRQNSKHADQLKQLLTRYKVASVDELQTVIEKHATPSPLFEVTQQVIASLGVATLEEFEKALEDEDLAALFPHDPKTTPQMFLLAQSLIRKAKARVKAHLLKLDEYDLSQMDETALTVFAGVKKDGRDVTIVFRPAYDNFVIIYYQSEKDVLDYEEHELWVDTGKDVRRITFGHILKTNSIRRFPI